jgi:uncharacterized protein (UPF0332 family)
MNFNAYLNRGLIKRQLPSIAQIEKQISRADKDIATISQVMEIDPEWAAMISYQAMLRAGRALLFAHGYLPADGRQHKTVVEITGKLLGEECVATVLQFEKLRKKRNVFFYDSVDTANKTEARKAAESAQKLIGAVKEKLLALNPQYRLKMK